MHEVDYLRAPAGRQVQQVWITTSTSSATRWSPLQDLGGVDRPRHRHGQDVPLIGSRAAGKELPENECPPVRIKLLSERLLAWRDTEAAMALTDEFCAHRGVSLWFGRNEECGLRCPYHGWKYDHHRSVHRRSLRAGGVRICKKIKLKSYPLVERGGVLWTYMGPPRQQPPLPEWEFVTVSADAQSITTKRLQE